MLIVWILLCVQPVDFRTGWRNRFFKKLDEMINDKILTPVHERAEWVSRMMVVGKPDGDVRICLDSFELNKAI